MHTETSLPVERILDPGEDTLPHPIDGDSEVLGPDAEVEPMVTGDGVAAPPVSGVSSMVNRGVSSQMSDVSEQLFCKPALDDEGL